MFWVENPGMAECFWIWISHKVPAKILTVATDIWSLGYGWRIYFHDRLTPSFGKWYGYCKEPSGFHHMNLFLEVLDITYNKATEYFERKSPNRTQMSACVLLSNLKVTFCNFHNILLVTLVSYMSHWKRLYQGLNTTTWESLVKVLEAGDHSNQEALQVFMQLT